MWYNYDARVLIRPKRGRNEAPLPPKAIMIIVPEDLNEFSSLTNCKHTKDLFLSRIYSCESNKDLCIVGPLLGAPQAVMLVEKLVTLGVREIAVLGWCGSLQDGVEIGDVVIPEEAFSEEGTSKHYISGSRISSPCPPSWLSELEKNLHIRDVKIHRGSVWTTDAPYRETINKVLFYQGCGALAVDMETSALFSIAKFRGISLGIFLMVSDSLGRLKWKPGMNSSNFLKTKKIMLETLRNFVQKQENKV